MARAEQIAQGKALGLWTDAKRIAPWDWRNGQRIPSSLPRDLPRDVASEPMVYVTETGSKYHRGGCRHLDQSKHAIPLSRARSAYEPCKVCNP